MNKNELEFEKARLAAGKFQKVIDFLSLIIQVGGALLAIKFIFSGLEPIINGNSPEAIGALAKLVEAMQLGDVLGYAWGAVATGMWVLERRGKQRAIKKKGEYQRIAEDGEPNRTSSGLTATGGTP